MLIILMRILWCLNIRLYGGQYVLKNVRNQKRKPYYASQTNMFLHASQTKAQTANNPSKSTARSQSGTDSASQSKTDSANK